jgi:hypothetical protein
MHLGRAIPQLERVMATPKSSSKPEDLKPQTALPGAVSLVGKIRTYSWGALLGLVATGAAPIAFPTVQEKPWLELPLGMLCIAGGMLIERAVNYFVGRQVDSWIQHRAARFQAELELAKLVKYRARGTLNEWDARRIAALAAKRDILGGRKPGTPRGPYKKKRPAEPAVAPSQTLPEPKAPPREPRRPAA